MALILLIETATEICSVGISQDGNVLVQLQADNNFQHGQQITRLIQSCTKAAKIELAEIDAVAISKGPGSYTALRIGAATAKGICYALDKPLIAVDTLQALALASSRQNKVENALYAPMIDARRMEVYTAFYDDKGTELIPPHALIVEADSLNEHIDAGKTIILSGNGAEKCRSVLPQQKVLIEPIFCSAALLSPIAEKKWKASSFESIAYYSPFYLKPPNITTPKKRL